MTLDEFFSVVDGIQPDENGCKIWPFRKDRDGYGKVWINGTKGKGGGAHRWALEYKLGRKIFNNLCCCHSCDNPSCVNPEHLWEGTFKENAKDRDIKGRFVNGFAGKKHNEGTIDILKNIAQNREYKPMLGKNHKKESKEKISKARKEKYSGKNHPCYGIPRTVHTNIKIYYSKMIKNVIYWGA